MLTEVGHLTYCTNIHAGETWRDHFYALQINFPAIKEKLSPNKPMGIGLRLSNEASIDLIKKENLSDFKQWLREHDAYVFTMNGFPYGGFHRIVVKDQVHTPDWVSNERVEYTLRLFQILAALIPEGMDGGVSTSPLSYKPWFTNQNQLYDARGSATKNIIRIIGDLIQIHQSTGKLLHLDIEPEPDGLLESGTEFIEWFENDLLPAGIPIINSKMNISNHKAEDLIKEHLRLCYDVCHFAVGYEDHQTTINLLAEKSIKVGKIQISAALKADMNSPEIKTESIKENFSRFNEPVYLHQVVARTKDGNLLRYPDLPEALNEKDNSLISEWRAHFHVPVFAKKFDLLSSTHDEIIEVLSIQKKKPFTNHLEVETYTWEVLPQNLRLPLRDSIIRELQWAKDILEN
ncbi:MAG: metabolite traffic protein EboE [Ginsengibacter sp.]